MYQALIEFILLSHQFQQLKIKKDNHQVKIENEHYIFSIEFYDCHVAEEIIYDKYQQDVYFYFHHECQNDNQTTVFIQDFFNIVFDLLGCENNHFIDFWDLKDYRNSNDNPYYFQNQF